MISLDDIKPTGNHTRILVSVSFLGEAAALLRSVGVTIVGSDASPGEGEVCLIVQGPIIPDSAWCSATFKQDIVSPSTRFEAGSEEPPRGSLTVTFIPRDRPRFPMPDSTVVVHVTTDDALDERVLSKVRKAVQEAMSSYARGAELVGGRFRSTKG